MVRTIEQLETLKKEDYGKVRFELSGGMYEVYTETYEEAVEYAKEYMKKDRITHVMDIREVEFNGFDDAKIFEFSSNISVPLFGPSYVENGKQGSVCRGDIEE